MSILLSDFLSDQRLARLFGSPSDQCALQLWLLQIKKNNLLESHLLYGRALPYNFENNKWNASRDDKFIKYDEFEAQVIRIHLYCNPKMLYDVVDSLSNGDNLSQVNRTSSLSFSHDIDNNRFGAFSLAVNLSIRPIAYLPMKNNFLGSDLQSTHMSAGAFSASICNLDKNNIFKVNDTYDKKLIEDSVNKLHNETGLDFLDSDADRLGDLELLVFPTLDEKERNLFYIEWIKKGSILSISLDQSKYEIFQNFQFKIELINDNRNVNSILLEHTYSPGEKIKFEYQLPEYLIEIIDGVRIEVFAKQSVDTNYILYAQYNADYIREINLNLHVNSMSGQVKNSWLNKHAILQDQHRITKLETINQQSNGIQNKVGNRGKDPWVDINRTIKKNLHESKELISDGRFFDQWEDGKGSGRIEFAEWMKNLIHTNISGSVFIFDPYFEDAGISLLATNASVDTEYVVFTTRERKKQIKTAKGIEKVFKKLCDWITKKEIKNSVEQQRLNNLLLACENLNPLLRRIKLKIYALAPKAGIKPAFHDRYILILNKTGNPIKGFHLSNSIQNANENYPLLITPIPKDTLIKVVQYVESILETSTYKSNEELEFIDMKKNLIFDSSKYFSSPTNKTRYEPLAILENRLAGDVLASWLCEPSLKGKYSTDLKIKLKDLGCIEGESLRGEKYKSLGEIKNLLTNCSLDDFDALWSITGGLLAHTITGDSEIIFSDLSSEIMIQRLSKYISKDTNIQLVNQKNIANFNHLFTKDIEYLLIHLRGAYDFLERRPVSLDWASFYAIKILWHANSAHAIQMLKGLFRDSDNTCKQALSTQLISEIAMDIEFGMDDKQIVVLLKQSEPFIKWLGYSALEKTIEKNTKKASLLSSSIFSSDSQKIQFLGWAINRSSHIDSEQTNVNKIYITELLKILPHQLSLNNFKKVIDSLRGRMQKLGWCEPWLNNYIIVPLLNSKSVEIDTVCDLWIEELIDTLNDFVDDNRSIFTLNVEGQMTNYTALYTAGASVTKFESSIKKLNKVLKTVTTPITAPLSSTINWKKWDSSLKVAFWIYGFSKWVEYFMEHKYDDNSEFIELKRTSYNLAMHRQKDEWAAMETKGSEFYIFLKERS